jgi:hypothetical protein
MPVAHGVWGARPHAALPTFEFGIDFTAYGSNQSLQVQPLARRLELVSGPHHRQREHQGEQRAQGKRQMAAQVRVHMPYAVVVDATVS